MKNKRLYFVFIALALSIVIFNSFSGKSEYYDKYKKYKYAFFPNYSSINSSLSKKDRLIAEEITDEAKTVFTFIGDSIPEKDVGELNRYYRLDPDITKIKVSIDPIAGDFIRSKGYVWVVYSVTRLKSNGETHSGSWDIISYWETEKQDDGKWKVVKIKEPA